MIINAILRIIPADAIIALVLLAVEAVFWIGASETPLQSRFYPKALAVCAAVLTFMMLYRALREHSRKGDNNFVVHKRVLVVVFIMLAYIGSINYLGYIIGTWAFVSGTMLYLGLRDKMILLIVPIFATLLMYLVFNNVLYVILPQGVILQFLDL